MVNGKLETSSRPRFPVDLTVEQWATLSWVYPEVFLTRLNGRDSTTGAKFKFATRGWEWQQECLVFWEDNPKSIILKARQLGITWLAGAYALWYLLFRPGSRILIVSISESEASKVISRIWDMFSDCPDEVKTHVTVYKPQRGRPTTDISFQHLDGSFSSVVGLPSTPHAGHGETAALAILDEFAHQDYANASYTALLPTASGGGKIVIISTAHGSAAGNKHANVWHTAEQIGFARRFYGWRTRPERDSKWFDKEAIPLPPRERGEQYPNTPEEAFMLTGDCYFDPEILMWYEDEQQLSWLYKAIFKDDGEMLTSTMGYVRIFEEPLSYMSYVIGADCATGRGDSYSAACVLRMDTAAKVADIQGKLIPEDYAHALYYLGRYYNDARIAIDMGGGYGEPIVLYLRQGPKGAPPYPSIYRHREIDRVDRPERLSYGFPMSAKMRAEIVSTLATAIQKRVYPSLDKETLSEMRTFIYYPTGTSPRAAEGCNDDRVFALGLATEMVKRYGPAALRQRVSKPKLSRDFPSGSPEYEIPFAQRYPA